MEFGVLSGVSIAGIIIVCKISILFQRLDDTVDFIAIFYVIVFFGGLTHSGNMSVSVNKKHLDFGICGQDSKLA